MEGKLKQSLMHYQYKRKMEDYAIERGYIPFRPQLFEEYDSFSSRNPRLSREDLVVVLTRLQQILLLRPDLTSALMKEIYPIALKQEKCKVFYQSTIYRNLGLEIQEINQFGIENLGSISESTEIEVIVMAIDLLSSVPFILEIGHTGFLDGLFKACKLSEPQKAKLKKLIYLKNKDELERYIQSINLPLQGKNVFDQLFKLQGKGEKLNTIIRSCILNVEMENAVEKLIKLQEISPFIHLDLSIVNKFDYYDGIVIKGYYDNLNKEVLSGGRYLLVSEDSENRLDAIGFSIDTDAWITSQMRDDK
ncbi:ATP phosphoribosyltransferase regulatory subunit [Gottfriedia luciferensis]|uniref:ATP phosphoribosyltransferase regulatory subunit n=1 Tax=Gottfriedia luciferensis TaxID=178774 RepID=UPI000B446F27|nr:ATP phosphoribosyltransferase regulatory subunit [Gottfriedia luciferensis]